MTLGSLLGCGWVGGFGVCWVALGSLLGGGWVGGVWGWLVVFGYCWGDVLWLVGWVVIGLWVSGVCWVMLGFVERLGKTVQIKQFICFSAGATQDTFSNILSKFLFDVILPHQVTALCQQFKNFLSVILLSLR